MYVYYIVHNPEEENMDTQVSYPVTLTVVNDAALPQIVADNVAAAFMDRLAIAMPEDDRISSVDKRAPSFRSQGDREKKLHKPQTTAARPRRRV